MTLTVSINPKMLLPLYVAAMKAKKDKQSATQSVIAKITPLLQLMPRLLSNVPKKGGDFARKTSLGVISVAKLEGDATVLKFGHQNGNKSQMMMLTMSPIGVLPVLKQSVKILMVRGRCGSQLVIL